MVKIEEIEYSKNAQPEDDSVYNDNNVSNRKLINEDDSMKFGNETSVDFSQKKKLKTSSENIDDSNEATKLSQSKKDSKKSKRT